MRPSPNEKKIEQLKDEFYDWWFDQFRQSAYMPSIFEWFILKLSERDIKIKRGDSRQLKTNFMKNVILTNNELQMNLFIASAGVLCEAFKVPKGYFLTWTDDEKFFYLQLWNNASEKLVSYEIGKGEYQMNDTRLGVRVTYLKWQAQLFIQQVEEWFNEKHRKEFPVEATELPNSINYSLKEKQTIKVCMPREALDILASNGIEVEEIV